jgi:rare lipoprotein A
MHKTEGYLWALRLSEANRNVCISWYGEPYNGRLAASGIRFDMNARHVAHRWLPFGTKVAFYNPLNGAVSHGVIVDRGPFIDGRAFDISYSMALELGVVECGIAIVRCWVPELPGELLIGRPSSED